MAQETVTKLLFCQGNSRIIRSAFGVDAHNLRTFVEDQTEPLISLRRVRKAIVDAYRQGRLGRQII